MIQRAKKRNKRTEDVQSLVLRTALKLFTVKGYFNTSVHDIQRAAEVSIGSIYHHFKNKEGIAKALYDELLGQMTRAVSEIYDHHGTAHDRCRAIVVHLFEQTETFPESMQYVMYAKHQEFMPGEKSVCSARSFEIITEIVREGIATGEIRDIDPNVAGAALLGGALRLIRLRLDGVLEKPVTMCMEEIWQCAWKSVSA